MINRETTDTKTTRQISQAAFVGESSNSFVLAARIWYYLRDPYIITTLVKQSK